MNRNESLPFIESTPENVEAYVRAHGLAEMVDDESPERVPNLYESVDPTVTEPMQAQWPDLVRLHSIIRSRKVTTVLEFGVGKSTLVMADALSLNLRDYGEYVEANLRRANPFELHCVDDMPGYIEVTRRALPKSLESHVTFHTSEARVGTFAGRVCTFYDVLPNICPDFIYLDAPSQFSVKGEVRGISTRQPDRLPMAGDLLAIEHFLLPGTLILVDGRTANARFLRANLQRAWEYMHHPNADVHTFELVETPLGRHNRRQVDFSLGSEWLESVDRPHQENSDF